MLAAAAPNAGGCRGNAAEVKLLHRITEHIPDRECLVEVGGSGVALFVQHPPYERRFRRIVSKNRQLSFGGQLMRQLVQNDAVLKCSSVVAHQIGPRYVIRSMGNR